MARKTIRAKLASIARRFPYRLPNGFLYAKDEDLSKRFTSVIVHALIYDPERGHSVLSWNPHRRNHNWTHKGWFSWLAEKGFTILGESVLEAINVKHGSDWRLLRIVGFNGSVYGSPTKILPEGENVIHRNRTRKRSKGNKSNGAR